MKPAVVEVPCCVGQAAATFSGPGFARLARSILATGNAVRFRAHGSSMEPFIRGGDVVTLVPLEHEPRLGDVVAGLLPDPDRLVVHRLVGRARAGLVLKGDALPGPPTELVPRDALVGRVAAIVRAGRPVRLGLGPERAVIALLSRRGLTAVLWRWYFRLRTRRMAR